MNHLKKLTLPLLVLALVSNSLRSEVIITEDFSSYASGVNVAANANWNAKWQSNSDQQDLFLGTGSGAASLDLSIATNNYHITHQTGFSLSGTEEATLTMDFRFTHNGGGNAATTNKGFWGLGFSTGNQWWHGAAQSVTRVDARLANRNGAVGMPIAQNPWIEGWIGWNNFGVDPNGGADSVSNWITEELTVSINGGTYWTQAVLKDAGGTVLFTGTSIDTGVAADTVIYATMTNGFVDSGTATTEALTNISSVEVDAFSVNVVPEPETYAMILGLSVLGFVYLRRLYPS
ncbi:MAG: hypothetical protein ACON39_05605 [Coraliomargaritaceae bacterium]